jgi:hypothetical protein
MKEVDLSFLKKAVPQMSYRQQLKYALEKSKEESAGVPNSVSEAQVREMLEYHQDEELRVIPTQKLPPIGSKQEYRSRLTEEAQRLFKPIRKTIFMERKHVKLGTSDTMICSCKPPDMITAGEYKGLFTIGCGRRCLNRVVSTECCVTLCPAGEDCTNRRFQLQTHVQLYPVKTPTRGWGLAAGQPIRKGQFVIQYLGEVYSIDSEYGCTRLERYKENPCTYLMSTSHNEVIDPARKGNMARFINHSCDPNCETQKWNVLGEVCVGIFAKRNIDEDEELTFDYRFDTHKTTLTRCLCGSANCRQYLGLIPNKQPVVRDWTKSLDNAKCVSCKKPVTAEDTSFVMCGECQRGWHSYCMKGPIKGPREGWICLKCTRRASKKPELQHEKFDEEEIKISIEKKKMEVVLKNYMDEIVEMEVKLFWETTSIDDIYDVTIRGINAKKAEAYIKEISKDIISENHVEDDICEVELRFEKIYLKNVLHYYRKANFDTHITIEESVDQDEIYALDQLTLIILTGRRKSIFDIAEKLFEYIDKLVVFTLLISQTESRIIEQNLATFKILNQPAEVRVSKEKAVNESPHPFIFYSREDRKLVFIGTEE